MPPPLPDDARLWVFTADRPLPDDHRAALMSRVSAFLSNWHSHGRAVPASASLLHGRFLTVAAHLTGGVSGCGIDSLVHEAEAVAGQLGFVWLDGLHVAYRNAEGDIRVVPRSAFRGLVCDGVVTADTSVFDTTIDTLGELDRVGLERQARDTWHGRVFRIPEPAEGPTPTVD